MEALYFYYGHRHSLITNANAQPSECVAHFHFKEVKRRRRRKNMEKGGSRKAKIEK